MVKATSQIERLRAELMPLIPRTAGGIDLVRRLESPPGNDERLSAEWELAVFGWLLRRAEGVEPGPEHGNGTKNPDFLVETTDGRTVFVECVLARPSRLVSGERARIKDLKRALDSVPHNGCGISLIVHSVGETTPRWRQRLAEVRESTQRLSERPETELVTDHAMQFDGWDIQIIVRRLSSGLDGVLDWSPDPTRIVDDEKVLVDRIEDKLSTYSRLEHPLIVAVGLESGFSDDSAVFGGLFGSSVLHVPLDGSAPVSGRALDGFWFNERGFRDRGVPAILVSHDFHQGICDDESIAEWVFPLVRQHFSGRAMTLRRAGDAWVLDETL